MLQENKAVCMDAVPLSLVTRNQLLPIFLQNLLLAGWCYLVLLVGVFLKMFDLLHRFCGLCDLDVLLRGWHNALSTFQCFVLHP